LSARTYEAVASKYFGRPVVIKIRSGAATVTGSHEVVRAAPDGYTLLYGANHLFTLKYLGSGMPFDPAVDLKPIAFLCDMPWALCVAKDAPWNTVQEFVDYVKANPGKVRMANAGARTVAQVPALQMEMSAGLEFIHVPYDGGGPANQSVMQGDTHAVFASMGWAYSSIKDGLVKGLAVTSHERFKLLPEIPTLEEFGIPSYITLWSAIYGPKDLPDEIVKKINDFTQEIIKDPKYIEMNDTLGNVVTYEGPEKFKERIAEEEKALSELVEVLKIR
jgi:tripartite-type tricarboxylate transporter receptor subunit TctC